MSDKPRIYLDHAASTPVLPDVLQAMLPYFSDAYANPSSLHSMGQSNQKAINSARKTIAGCIGAEPEDLIFTASGTESDNIAILGTVRKLKTRGNHIITSNIEHPAVMNTFKHLEKEGFEISIIPVDAKGLIHVEDVQAAITPKTIFISIMYVNNEIGTIQPVEAIAALADQNNIIFHTDAVQAFGKIDLNLKGSHIHLLSASAHKIYGPKGIGLLYRKNKGIKAGMGRFLEQIVYGGGHEFGLRPSTENVPGIVGFAKAVVINYADLKQESARQLALRDDFIDWALKNLPDCFLNGDRTRRLFNNINLGLKYIEGESLLLYLDQKGIEVSTGSACSSKSLEPSHVLLALGMKKEDAHGSIRISLGRGTTSEQLEIAKQDLSAVVDRLREYSPLVSRN